MVFNERAIEILYSDDAIIVVDKPAGLLSVPGRGPDKQDCAVNRIKQLFPDLPEQPSVHRLDMDTSGILVLARHREAHRALSRQFQERQVQKRYEALLNGIISTEAGIIELPFRLDVDDRPRQIYDEVHGKRGITQWRLLGVAGGLSRLEMFPLTGRTHQLRLHTSHPKGLGVPILGDRLYGTREEGQRMHLHATDIAFTHPDTGKPVQFNSPAPF